MSDETETGAQRSQNPDQAPRLSPDARAGARRSVMWSLALVCGMGALSFASVPLYDLFCRVTGLGGTTQVAEGASGDVRDETMLVRFDANIDRGLNWRFEPVQREMRVRVGETVLAFYRAKNIGDTPLTGTATFNVAPYEVGSYFAKIDCFCFTEQTLQPGQEVDMPVSFFVDPELLDDADYAGVKTITLSYTFFEKRRTASAPQTSGAANRAVN